MNVFRLHEDREACVKQTPDKLVSVGVKEHAQILSSAMRLNGYDYDFLYKHFQKQHPLVKWAADKPANFADMVKLAHELSEEFEYRYGHEHSSYTDVIAKLHPEELGEFPHGKADEQPACGECGPVGSMCNECLVEGDVVESYRNNLVNEKNWDLTWTGRDVPEWYR